MKDKESQLFQREKIRKKKIAHQERGLGEFQEYKGKELNCLSCLQTNGFSLSLWISQHHISKWQTVATNEKHRMD